MNTDSPDSFVETFMAAKAERQAAQQRLRRRDVALTAFLSAGILVLATLLLAVLFCIATNRQLPI